MKQHAGSVLALVLWLAPNMAHAASCEIVNLMGVAFGSYRTRDSEPLDGMGAIHLTCRGVFGADMIVVSLGRGLEGSFSPRVMLGPSRLEYNLYLDPARTTVWGDGTSGTGQMVFQPPNGQVVPIEIYGRIPPGQRVRVGNYSDTVVVNVIF